MKRVITVLLSLLFLVGLIPTALVSAAEKEIVLLAGSDFQTDNFSTSNVEKVLSTLAIHGITKADAAFFCGDYTLGSTDSKTSDIGITALRSVFKPIVGTDMVFVQGNHDHEETDGLSRAGNNDPANGRYGVFVIHEDQYPDWGNNRKATENLAASLRSYLEQKRKSGWNKPVFILCHIPLHWSNRTQRDGSGTDANLIFDVLNEYGSKGLNILYLYGHNHSGGYDDFMGAGAVYLKKGDSIEVCQGDKWKHETRTLKFTYMNAGFIGYYSTKERSADATVTMSVFRIKGNAVTITRYDGDFNLIDGRYGIHNLKSKGVFCEDFYKKYKFHADLNTLEYSSSRKVTATDDVAVKTPMPKSFTTTAEPIEETTSAVNGVVIQKGTTTQKQTTSNDKITTAATSADTEAADPTQSGTQNVNENVTTTVSTRPSKATTEAVAAVDDVGIPLWVWAFPIGGGLVLISSVVVLILTSKKKKS